MVSILKGIAGAAQIWRALRLGGSAASRMVRIAERAETGRNSGASSVVVTCEPYSLGTVVDNL